MAQKCGCWFATLPQPPPCFCIEACTPVMGRRPPGSGPWPGTPPPPPASGPGALGHPMGVRGAPMHQSPQHLLRSEKGGAGGGGVGLVLVVLYYVRHLPASPGVGVAKSLAPLTPLGSGIHRKAPGARPIRRGRRRHGGRRRGRRGAPGPRPGRPTGPPTQPVLPAPPRAPWGRAPGRTERDGTVWYGAGRYGVDWRKQATPTTPPPRDRRRIRWRCSGGGDGCRILGRGRGEAGEVRRLAVLSDAAPQGVQPLPHLLRQVATTPPAFLGEGVGPAGPTVWEEGVGGDRRDEISAMIRAHGRGPRRRRPPCRGSSIAGVRGRRESGEAAGARTYPLPGRRKPCGSTAGPWGWGCPAGRGPGPEEEDGGCQTARRLLVTDYAEGSGRSPSPVSGLGREVKGGAWISHGEVLSGG